MEAELETLRPKVLEAGVSTAAITTDTPLDSSTSHTQDFISAAQNGDVATLHELLTKTQRNPQSPISSDGITLLHWAAINNRLTACRYLIEQGCDVNAKGGELNATPLHWACRNGLVYIVDFLISHGADPVLTDSQGFNSLHLAVHSSNVMLVIYFLASERVPINSLDPQNRTPLHWAAYQGDILSVNALLDHGADSNLQDTQGHSSLHWAVAMGSVISVKRLVEEGCDLTLTTAEHKTAKQLAQEAGRLKQYQSALKEAGYKLDGTLVRSRVKNAKADLLIFLMPYIILPLGFYTAASTSSLPIGIFFGLLVTFICINVTNKFLVQKYYSGRNAMVASPIFAGIFTSSCFWGFARYLLYVLPKTLRAHFFFNIAFLFLLALTMSFFIKAATWDPGFVPRSSGKAQKVESINTLLEQGTYDSKHFCLATYTRKPIRSHYDKFTKRLVARFDHYCPWINNAVGLRNYRPFFFFIVLLTICILMTLTLLLYYFEGLSFDEARAHDPFTLVSSVWPILQLVWVMPLLLVQLIQIANGYTTHELSVSRHGGHGGSQDFGSLPQDHPFATSSVTSPSSRPATNSLNNMNFAPLASQNLFCKACRLLGFDHFGHAMINLLSCRGPSPSNPNSAGLTHNFRDFLCPLGCTDIFEATPGGIGSFKGKQVDYYTLYEIPQPTNV